ncbi:unnamed protein product [Rangifer tarandus platyrhynchus]|uniref:Uncharacterized protein n=1 Tax=Rangifer tarandus platyrhynchus TaxID=3082113 RepID=A0AC59YKC5_RANTA
MEKRRRTSQSLCAWPPSSLASHGCLPGGQRVPRCEGGAAASVCAHRSCRQEWGPSGLASPSRESELILTTSSQVALLCCALTKPVLCLYPPPHDSGLERVRAERPSAITDSRLAPVRHGKTETQRGDASCIGPHGESEAGLELKPGL